MTRTMPGGGTATGTKIGLHTFPAMAFAASLGAPQAVLGGAAATPVTLDIKEMDTDGWHVPPGFRPTIPGLYLVTVHLAMSPFAGTLTLILLRGGLEVARSTSSNNAASISTLVALNGTSDLLTVGVAHTGAGHVSVLTASAAGILLGRV